MVTPQRWPEPPQATEGLDARQAAQLPAATCPFTPSGSCGLFGGDQYQVNRTVMEGGVRVSRETKSGGGFNTVQAGELSSFCMGVPDTSSMVGFS